ARRVLPGRSVPGLVAGNPAVRPPSRLTGPVPPLQRSFGSARPVGRRRVMPHSGAGMDGCRRPIRRRSVSEATARAEAELLLRSREDPAAFRAFYDQWSAAVLAYFQRRVHDPDLALELTAETFAVAFEKRARFTWMGKSPGAWLFGIAKRILF